MSSSENDGEYPPKQRYWKRALCAIVILVGYGISEALLWLLAIFQFFWTFSKGNPNTYVMSFGVALNKWNTGAIRYCLWISDDPPFPFQVWPDGSS